MLSCEILSEWNIIITFVLFHFEEKIAAERREGEFFFSKLECLNHLIFHRSASVAIRFPRSVSCSADCVCACLGRGCALCAALTLAQTCVRACVRASLVPAPLTHTQRRGIVAYCHVSSSTSRYRGRGAVIISNPNTERTQAPST